MSGVEMRLWPSVPGAGWLPSPLWPSKGLIGQNTYREDSLHNWRLSSYISPCLHCSATLRNTSHPSLAGSQIQARKSVHWLGGRGGEQATFPFFPPETCPRRPAVWPGLESQRASQPGKPQNRLGNSRGEDGLLGQGREVRKGERQMGKQRRDCQGEGCSRQGVGGCGSTPPFPGCCLSLPGFIGQSPGPRTR